MTLLTALFIAYILWPLYVFCMAMLRAHQTKSVTVFAWCLAFPFIAIAIVIDVLLNFTLFAFLTFDFPKRGEWTFSQRLNRLVKDDGWRGSLSRWIAANLLDPYDPSGKHIK